MKKRILAFALLSVMLLLAASLAGKWQGRIVVEGSDNDMNVLLTLKQDGDLLTGTIGTAEDPSMAIELRELKVAGDKVTFDVPYQGQTFHFNLTAKGTSQMEGALRGATEDGSPVEGKVTFKRTE